MEVDSPSLYVISAFQDVIGDPFVSYKINRVVLTSIKMKKEQEEEKSNKIGSIPMQF